MNFHISTDFLELVFLLAVIVWAGLNIVYPYVAHRCRAYFLKHMTTVDDLPLLGLQRNRKIQGTAVICGGSISGLLTARVCADHFTDVLIIDPELTEIERTKPSARIPQYDSLHGYLAIVFEGMRRLFPNFEAEVRKAGGIIAPADVKPYFSGVLLPAPYDEYAASGHALPATMYMRRPQLENLLRKLVLASPDIKNVHTMVGTVRGIEVQEVEAGTEGPPHVGSVAVRMASGREIRLKSPALVVDCTGDSQAGYKWLKKAGYDFPPETRLDYDQKLHYVTVTFSVPPSLQRALPIPDSEAGVGGSSDESNPMGWLYTFVPHPARSNVGFVLGRMDNDTMQLCCGAWGDADLPRNAADIVPFVASLNTPERSRVPVPEWLMETLQMLAEEGVPQFKPLKIRPCSNIQYHALPKALSQQLPANFVAVGDSVLQLNPIYAQGCSKAMMGAATLNAHLFSCPSTPQDSLPYADDVEDDPFACYALPDDFARTYFRAVGEHGKALWDSTKTFDYGFSTTRPVPGETLDHGRWARLWLDLFVDAAIGGGNEGKTTFLPFASPSPALASTLWHVRMLLAPPTDMFAPRAVFSVLGARLRARISRIMTRGSH